MVFLILVGGVSAIMAWENRGHRTCVLDGERAQYVCVIGEHSVENGNFHNVYIRLKAQKHGKKSGILKLNLFCFTIHFNWSRILVHLSLNQSDLELKLIISC